MYIYITTSQLDMD